MASLLRGIGWLRHKPRIVSPTGIASAIVVLKEMAMLIYHPRRKPASRVMKRLDQTSPDTGHARRCGLPDIARAVMDSPPPPIPSGCPDDRLEQPARFAARSVHRTAYVSCLANIGFGGVAVVIRSDDARLQFLEQAVAASSEWGMSVSSPQ